MKSINPNNIQTPFSHELELDRRLERYENGETTFFSWDDIKVELHDNSEKLLEQYNKEIDLAEAEIERGEYLLHDEVEKLFAERRKKLNGN